jgi:cytochrome P450
MHETVHGQPLTDDEVVSILRNWTAGDLSSLAASVGVIAYLIATRPEVQEQVRSRVAAGDAAWVESAIEELLRIDDPFLTSRRTTTADSHLDGKHIPAGDRVLLSWTSANRDSSVFPSPDAFDPAANAHANLVFGIGPHVCPGRDLTLMELRVVLEELVKSTTWIELTPGHTPVRETLPMGGWAEVEVVLT